MIPKYQEVIQFIEEGINKGTWLSHTKLPSESNLMARFETSRITVTRALKELEHKGIIYRKRGKGSFVSEDSARRHRVVSLIIPHSEGFYSGGEQYTRSICKYSEKAGFLCSVHYTDQSSRKERKVLKHLLKEKVSGIILYPIGNRNIDLISQLLVEKYPLVLLDRKLEEVSCSVVESDNFQGAYQLVAHLLEAGHEDIAFVGARDSKAANERYRGYCHAIQDHGLPINPDFIIDHFSNENSEEQQEIIHPVEAGNIVKKLRAGSKKPTALFCINDLVAFNMMQAATQQGYQIPSDISIAGFDNLSFIQQLETSLTTVEQDFPEIGRVCIETLFSRITNPGAAPIERSIPTKLIIRDSVAVINKHSE